MPVIQVVLVDDHELMRQGLRAILEQEEGIRVIGEAGSGEFFLQQVQKGLRPDVVLMDLQMKGISGVEATKRLKQLLPRIQVIGLSAQEEEHAALAMRRAGAFGYVIKAAPVTDLVKVVRAAYTVSSNAHNAMSDEVKNRTSRSARRTRKHRMPHNLTRRELDVVRTLMQGCSNKEIARQLVISERTVQTHLSNIFAKMQVTSRTEVVLAAINNGWLPATAEMAVA
ncbi:MAG: response regulator transcription factor [Caldilineaceae bacterium]|nr:response regulator transcription factor [Caldilineaceae bacterium]